MKKRRVAKGTAAIDPVPPSVSAVNAVVGQIVRTLESHKAENVVTVDLAGKTSIADCMVVASGRSGRQVGSLADHVLDSLRDCGVAAPRVEGLPHCDWVLIDAGDVIVHLFRPEVRQFYNLEKLWSVILPDEALAV